jgi:charged multivesicular body protein 1
MNYLRLASRVDAVASRVESAVKMNLVTKQRAGVVKGIDASLKSMDVEKVHAAAHVTRSPLALARRISDKHR